MSDSKHETTKIYLGFDAINIDKLIAPLISAIWRLGMRTAYSCENNVPKDYIWIQFVSSEDLLKFMKIIWDGTDGIHDTWELTLCPEEADVNSEGLVDITGFSASVRFPQKDLPFVMNQIRLHTIPNQSGPV